MTIIISDELINGKTLEDLYKYDLTNGKFAIGKNVYVLLKFQDKALLLDECKNNKEAKMVAFYS